MKKTLSYIFLALVTLSLAAQRPTPSRSILESRLIDAVTDIAMERMGDAVQKLEAILSVDSTYDAARYYLGLCQYSAGDYKQALNSFEQASALDPHNNVYLDALGMMYMELNQKDSLSSVYERQAKLRPAKYKTPYTLTMIGDVNFEKGLDSLAEASYKEALDLDENYAPAMAGLAQFYGFKGNMPAFFSSLSRFARNPEINCGAKCDYLRNMFTRLNPQIYHVWNAQLDSLVQICLEMHPSDTNSLKFAGSWYYGTERPEQGLVYYDRWLDVDPSASVPYFMKMSYLIEHYDWQGVIGLADRMTEVFVGDTATLVSVLSTKGDAYSSMNKKSKAFECYEKALELDPSNLTTLNNYAYYLSLAGKKLDKAAEMSRKTIEAEPDNATFLDTYGWILFLQKKPSQAKPYFKRAIIHGGNKSAVVLEHYSRVLEALGDKDLAEYYKNLSAKTK